MLMNNFSIIVRHSRTFCEKALQVYGIGFPEQIILMYLSRYDNVNQDTIAKHFMIDKGSIAKTLGKLEEKTLIDRTENPTNKREKLISLSKTGADILKYMNKALSEWNNCIFEGFSFDEIEQVERLTNIMATNVAKLEGKEWSSFDEDTKQ